MILSLNLFGMLALVALCAVYLVFCDDLMSIVCPILCVLLLSVKFYTDYSALLAYAWYIAVPFVLGLIFNLFYYRTPIKLGRFTYPLIAVSFALLFGGVGTISTSDYFNPVSLYYTVGLGLCMLLLYILMTSRLENEREYNRIEKMAEILYTVGLLASSIIILFYIDNFRRFLEQGSVLFFKPRNYIASVLLMSISSCCLMVEKRRIHLIGFAVMCAALAFSGSRSGLLFGAMVGFVCGVYICYLRRESIAEHRWYNWMFLAIIALLCYVGVKYIPVLYSSRMVEGNLISASETRVSFIELGIKDFLLYPINGIGIGNMSHVKIFKAIIPGSIVFFHNAVIQVMASMGIVGIMAYSWLFGEKMRLIIKNMHSYSLIFGFSYAGIFAMSLTNPGLFCPFPEAALMLLMFAVMEKETKETRHLSFTDRMEELLG